MYLLKKFEWGSVIEMMQFHERGLSFAQWGIKGHNRPWIIDNGNFAKGEKVVEVGGAYSGLPQYLSDEFSVEAWIVDDFGVESKEGLWSRWGDREELKSKYPSVKYVFERVGGVLLLIFHQVILIAFILFLLLNISPRTI